MGTPNIRVSSFCFGTDSGNSDPDLQSWGSADSALVGQAKNTPFFARIQAKNIGNKFSSTVAWTLYYNTSNSRTGATQVTTSGTNAIQLVDDPGSNITDSTATTSRVCSDPSLTWGDGSYLDTSTQTGAIAISASYYTEFQFCVQFTNNASDGTTYYLFLTGAVDGDDVSVTASTAIPSSRGLTPCSSSSTSSSSFSSSSSSTSSSSSSASSSSYSSSSQSSSSSSTSSSSSMTPSSSSSSTSSSSGATAIYSREDVSVLPTNDTDLATAFTPDDYTYVQEDDGNYVDQEASDIAVFLFKHLNPAQQSATITWKGQSDLAPATSTVYLQIYNYTSEEWETLDTDNSTGANTDFTLTGSKDAGATDYYDAQGYMALRTYQELP